MNAYNFSVSKIKGKMAENDIRQSDLAVVLGLSRRSIAKKLSGEVEWNASEICKFSERVNTEPGYFFIENKVPNA